MMLATQGGYMEEVSVTLGFTMNLGNFESIRFDYGLKAHVRDGETYDEAFDRISQTVEARLLARIKEEQDSK
jgi:hypothetical protein